MPSNKFESEVLLALKPFANPAHTKLCTQTYNFFPGLTLTMLGLRVPKIRAVEKKKFSFYNQPIHDVVTIWDQIWHATKVYEVRSVTAIYLQREKKKLTLRDWHILKEWAKTLDNWEHSDRLSEVYNELLNRFPKKIYPQLKSWNRSKNPWERRQSLVSLFLYFRPHRLVLPKTKIFPLITNLMDDDHFYVQKAVGWTLREIGWAYPGATWKYLQKFAAKIPSAGWHAATEKLSKEQKKELMKIRKR